MEAELPKIIIILGPTGAGKSSLAIDLCKTIPCEVVSADSMQVYRYLDIGTAKPTKKERESVPHHMIDIINPDESLDAFNYQKQANIKISEVIARNKIPIVVGGTGLYIRALQYGIFELSDFAIDQNKINKIKEEIAQWQKNNMDKSPHQLLSEVDVESSKKIMPNDYQRIERALLVYYATSRKISEFQKEHNFKEKRFCSLKIGLLPKRPELYAKINERVLNMVNSGIVDEVKNVLSLGYSQELKPLKTFNYRFFIEHLNNKITLDSAVNQTMIESRRFAKRQITWFKKEENVNWYEEVNEGILKKIIYFLHDIL